LFCYNSQAAFATANPCPETGRMTKRRKSMNNYELLYIIDNTLEDEKKEAVIEKFSQLVSENGGSVDKLDKWGTKKLAYPINFKNDGYYVLMNFQSNPELPLEFERQMRINDAIIRFIIVKK
jgi:small subunit ribosomal protein S6